METEGAAPLREAWYLALPGRRVKRGRMAATRLLGAPIVIGRVADGTVFALADLCPHRGIPLSCGRFDGREIECCYHGWRFAPDGRCTLIPSLAEGQRMTLDRIRARHYPAREVQGNIWVYAGMDPAAAPEIPVLPDLGPKATPRLVESAVFPGSVDHAVIGLMDPAHGPFVHRSWWWRSRRSIHEKTKDFVPSEWGFTMARHRPSGNSRAYRILGGAPETEIRFRLPGIRIEHVRAGRHILVNLTAITPLDGAHTQVHNAVYWTMPWLTPLKPLLRPFVRRFLEQDRGIVEKQQRGLAFAPPLLLINDADTQAKWYYRLKAEYARARVENRPFANPVTPRTLRWRS